MRFRAWPVLAALTTAGCGYHVAGRADLLPKDLHAIAIPAFANATTLHGLTQSLPQAIGREFIRRTRYRIVPDPAEADATLEGAVLQYFSYPTVFDARTGRASGVQMILVLDVKLRDAKTGNVLFQRPAMQVQNHYEISSDQVAYFEESDAALERLSAEVARAVVSAILENF
jgi:outer membrane lipopolysaccharide assembly protein LptE/RlpB